MKIGVIYCGFNMEEYIDDSLSPWVQAREERLGDNEWVISCVSVPFKEYRDMETKEDGTRDILRDYYNTFKIDSLITEPDFATEAEIRDRALQFLLKSGCEIIWLADADEFITTQQINDICDYVTLNKWISWFSISYKNYVFDNSTYLELPFTPPRIFRVTTNGYKIKEIYHDNDCLYTGQITGLGELKIVDVSYKLLPTKVIPQSTAWIRHMSWVSNEKSKLKCEYQEKHFGKGICGFKWEDNQLKFNEEYYKKYGLVLPKICKETLDVADETN